MQRALDAAAKGRTTIAVAHRISSIQNADVIVSLAHSQSRRQLTWHLQFVLKDGKVAEQGRHNELLARRGLYFEVGPPRRPGQACVNLQFPTARCSASVRESIASHGWRRIIVPNRTSHGLVVFSRLHRSSSSRVPPADCPQLSPTLPPGGSRPCAQPHRVNLASKTQSALSGFPTLLSILPLCLGSRCVHGSVYGRTPGSRHGGSP